jgi:sulfur-oxidizing protein SoxY
MPRPTLAAAIRSFTGDAPVKEGRVKFDIAPLVENGNAVPVRIEVDSPMTAEDHVRRIAMITEKNPQPDVAVFHFGPRAGRAQVALAELSDGSFAISQTNVVVTIAACIEDLSRA